MSLIDIIKKPLPPPDPEADKPRPAVEPQKESKKNA